MGEGVERIVAVVVMRGDRSMDGHRSLLTPADLAVTEPGDVAGVRLD